MFIYNKEVKSLLEVQTELNLIMLLPYYEYHYTYLITKPIFLNIHTVFIHIHIWEIYAINGS